MPDGRTLEWAVHKAGLGPVAGVDEAGRGACCGPVTVAACVLPPGPIPELSGLTDSKKLSPKKRDHYFDVVREVAEDWAVVHVPASYVDTWGSSTRIWAGCDAPWRVSTYVPAISSPTR